MYSRLFGWVCRHPSTRSVLLLSSPSIDTAFASSGWHGSLSRLSSTRLKSPSIMSGLSDELFVSLLFNCSQNCSLVLGSFGAYMFSILSLDSPCHGMVASIALPGISSSLDVPSVFRRLLFNTIATPAAFLVSGRGE